VNNNDYINENKSSKMYFNGVYIFSKCIICDFTYIIGLDLDLLQIQIC
jgi:hypothetical protein